MQEFKNSNQIKSFMKKEANRLNVNIHKVYSTFVARNFLERLSKYNNDEVLVKGSSAEIAYLGRLVRSITDVDLASINSLQVNYSIFNRVLSDSREGGLKFNLMKDPHRTPTGIYKLGFEACFDKMKQPLGVDFQENYNRLIEPERRIMPVIFEGDEPFEVYVPSFEEYLAEKLCIILESNKTDVLNTRVKDFYDIYELHGGKYDSDKFTEYFAKMLKLRGKLAIENASTLMLNKDFVEKHEKLWDSTREKYGFLDKEIDFAGAVYYTRAVLREQLQKNGNDMPDVISLQNSIKKRVKK